MHVQRTQIRVWDEKARNYVTVTVQVAVDVSKIAEALGPRAYRSKHKKSKSLHGAVEVTIK